MNLVNAVETGSIRQVKKCLANGADVNKPNKYGETPLERAYCNNDGKLVRFFVKKRGKNCRALAWRAYQSEPKRRHF